MVCWWLPLHFMSAIKLLCMTVASASRFLMTTALFLSLWINLWLAETSQRPISQTTWLKVGPHYDHYLRNTTESLLQHVQCSPSMPTIWAHKIYTPTKLLAYRRDLNSSFCRTALRPSAPSDCTTCNFVCLLRHGSQIASYFVWLLCHGSYIMNNFVWLLCHAS